MVISRCWGQVTSLAAISTLTVATLTQQENTMTKRATNIALTEAATQRLEDTLTRISQIRHYYGEEESNRVAAEFASGFGRLISMGGTIAVALKNIS